MPKWLQLTLCVAALVLALVLLFTPVWEDLIPPWTGKAVILTFATANIAFMVWAMKREW